MTKKLKIDKVYNIDCNKFMKDKPDNYYELAIVDPPYFEGPNKGKKYYQGKNNKAKCKEYKEIKIEEEE